MGQLNTPERRHAKLGIIIPACNEEEALPEVMKELRAALDACPTLADRVYIAVGANGCTDSTAEIARAHGAILGETEHRGYGYGCQAAIDALMAARLETAAYIFMAADGANDPAELPRLARLWEEGYDLVLGSRTDRPRNYASLFPERRVSNILLAAWTSLLAGFLYRDLGPFRVIDRRLFERMDLCEWTWGWTIEPQIKAPRLDAAIIETPVTDRPRVKGAQKVSGVSWRHSLHVGWRIASAGWRVAWSFRPRAHGRPAKTPLGGTAL